MNMYNMIYELMLYENIRFEEKTSSPLCYVFAVGPLWNFKIAVTQNE